MKRTLFGTLLSWLEKFIYLAVPMAAIWALIWPKLGGSRIDIDALAKLTLGLVAGIAISRTLERYVTLRNIEEQTKIISEVINVRLLRSALEYGIVDLFPRAEGERLVDMVSTVKNARGTLEICAIAWPAMLKSNPLREAIVEHSHSNDVRMLLLDPYSDEANRRAAIEAPLGRRTIADIETTADWLKAQIAKNKRFELRFYSLAPIVFLVITDQCAYVESYHFGRPEGVEGCIGGYVPTMKIRNLSWLGPRDNPYAFFKAHFQYLWDHTRGLRVHLNIALIEGKTSAYVVLENQTEVNIPMDGWKLTGQASHRPYQFSPDLVWENGERIVITSELNDHPQGHRILEAEGDFLGSHILILTNAAGAVVAEWPFPPSTK